MPQWLLERLNYCRDRNDYCHVGGIDTPRENYGLPCVIGTIYWEDGSTSINTRCLLCGSEKGE